MAPALFKRQACYLGQAYCDPGDIDSGSDDWWWSSTGLAVRYIIFIALFFLFVFYFLGGYIHARRRILAGKPPLAYHRWMVRRQEWRWSQQQQHNSDPYRQPGSYPMQSFQPPPPAYNQWDAPPVYQPPAGGSKTMADQNIRPVAPEERESGEGSSANMVYPPPVHPPPNHITQ
ncbi:hypothetical protein MBLNU457_7797t1 [Dothideomycetes sp. NU457]